MNRRRLLAVALLACAGSFVPLLFGKAPPATRATEYEGDLDRLRKYDPKSRASPEVMRSARRVFEHVSFVGLDAKRVRERLGPPHTQERIAGRPVWRYSYHDGEQGVVRNLWFDFEGQKVWGVEPLKTE